MLTILQNFTGVFKQLRDTSGPVHASYAAKHGYNFQSTEIEPPSGLRPMWAKLPLLLDWMQKTKPDAVALWLDGDTLLVRDEPLDAVLGDADLGLALVEVSNGEYYNTGVLFVRNSTQAEDFLAQVLKAGPFARQADGFLGCPYLGEQGRVNSMLKTARASGLRVQDLDHRYNSYALTPCKEPVVVGWHGDSLPATIVGMKKALAAKERRLASQGL